MELIHKTFDLIDRVTNSNYVVLRNIDLISSQQSSMENDIDVLVPREFIDGLSNEARSFGYEVYSDVNRCLYGAESHTHFKHHDDVHFDIVTGLYYRSAEDINTFVNVDIKLTKSMLNNKKEFNLNGGKMFVPSVDDELSHLVAHCIFDKRTVTDRYQKRIEELSKEMNDDNVKLLFDTMFYKVSDSIFKDIKNNNIDKIYTTYSSFIDY